MSGAPYPTVVPTQIRASTNQPLGEARLLPPRSEAHTDLAAT
jgi:hypothetical protein